MVRPGGGPKTYDGIVWVCSGHGRCRFSSQLIKFASRDALVHTGGNFLSHTHLYKELSSKLPASVQHEGQRRIINRLLSNNMLALVDNGCKSPLPSNKF